QLILTYFIIMTRRSPKSTIFPYTTLFRSSTTYETDVNNGSQYDTKQQQISLISVQNLPVGKVTLGAEHLKQKLESSVYHADVRRSEEHTSELQSRENLVCRLLLEKKNKKK